MKISKEAIEAGVRRYSKIKYPEDGYTDLGVVKEILEAALPHLQDCKASPQPVQSPPATATQVAIDDAEVERVGKAIYDEVVLQPIVAIGPYVADPTHEASRNARRAARAAIRAIREGGQRWGVWCKRDDARIGAFQGFPLGPTTDKEYLVSVIQAIRIGNDYEVRPYPGEREKTAEEMADWWINEIRTANSREQIKEMQAKLAAMLRDAKESKR